MIPEERRKEILNLLIQQTFMTVDEIAEALYVSPPTVRRDLAVLEKEGSIRRTHGGASWIDTTASVAPFSRRGMIHHQEKRRIGALAAGLLEDGDRIFIDSSSTCLCFAQAIREVRDLTILTNCFDIVEAVSNLPGVKIEIPGGEYDARHHIIFGDEAEEFVSRRNAGYSFVSCSGVDAENGFTGITSNDIGVKKVMQRHAAGTVMLLDHTKMEKICYYHVYDWNQVDILVTDETLPQELAEICSRTGIQVIDGGEKF